MLEQTLVVTKCSCLSSCAIINTFAVASLLTELLLVIASMSLFVDEARLEEIDYYG